jgi:AcrR family transcriptional regulator
MNSSTPSLFPQSTSNRLVKVASELFYSQGFQAVSIDSIVARAGLTKVTLYRHFRSKEELLLAVLKERHECRRVSLENYFSRRALSPEHRLLAVFDWLEEWFRSEDFRGCAFVNATVELGEINGAVRQMAFEHKNELRATLRWLASEAGLDDADDLADSLLLLIEGATTMALIERGSSAARRARRAAVVLIEAASQKSGE